MKLNQIKFALVALVATTFFVSCSNDDSSTPEVKKEISLSRSTALGSYLSDKDGRALYSFAFDANGQSSCSGGCEAVWPPFYVDNLTADKLGSGLLSADFGTITASSGKKQLTYKGWPLYHFAPMANGTLETSGGTAGDGVNGVWFVAKPDYSIMIAASQLLGHDGNKYKSDYTVGDGLTTYFTDANGKTLYTFKYDNFEHNNFTSADFSNNAIWSIYETDKIVVPSILDKTNFKAITVFGKKQLTYKGWPLYYFGQDGAVRGSNKGISFPAPGVWPVPVKDMAVAL